MNVCPIRLILQRCHMVLLSITFLPPKRQPYDITDLQNIVRRHYLGMLWAAFQKTLAGTGAINYEQKNQRAFASWKPGIMSSAGRTEHLKLLKLRIGVLPPLSHPSLCLFLICHIKTSYLKEVSAPNLLGLLRRPVLCCLCRLEILRCMGINDGGHTVGGTGRISLSFCTIFSVKREINYIKAASMEQLVYSIFDRGDLREAEAGEKKGNAINTINKFHSIYRSFVQ